ncbi:glycoside hydrolase family 125 protein [Paenibacillus sp. N3/727]|uniref:glycoside hydrolase family 125 protein n=1 Tax=Paenibacillus sp. N3/727 TaxID=2925845 RepID=UPI001F53B55C|nr:glycoside hydrolase family 125 protein [Paenibacillus sp. N3/727]UNK19426.1 glycoside hydrolase family 125 protein [Paenibacillus sp. N3/727]
MQTEYNNRQMLPLLDVSNQKPIDVGNGRLSASIGLDGLVRSVNSYHPTQGFITLTSIEQFPNDKFYDSNYVRCYRRRLVDSLEGERQAVGFGIRPQEKSLNQEVYYLEGKSPVFRYQFETAEVHSMFVATEKDEKSYFIHRFEVNNISDKEIVFPLTVGGRFSLNRCSYGQLTEGGPIPIPPLENRVDVQSNHMAICNSHLSARADMYLFTGKDALILAPVQTTANEPVNYEYGTELTLEQGESRIINMVYSLSHQEECESELTYTDVEELTAKAIQNLPKWKNTESVQGDKAKAARFIIQRNLDYIVSCCSMPICDEYMCVITDHQLLPLSWNRDSYYMMQLLLESEKKMEFLFEDSYRTEWKSLVQRIVKGHLLWMFEKADRPLQYWGRAYLTNGSSKDNVFQFDQQCYPLLELCDYYAQFGDKETIERLLPIAKDVLDMIMAFKHEEKWLFKTGETPADDKVDYPYHFSSQVLAWHTLQQLSELNKEFSFYDKDLAEWADQVRHDCIGSFSTLHNGKELFTYLTDLKGNFQKYHDANDLPAVYAPMWGFCSQDDTRWIHTMEFGFSEDNKGGFYPGRYGGLGSVHTPHPWPLGDAQELLFSDVMKDEVRRDRIFQKLMELVQWDGLYSEAVDEETGKVQSRHWFSWPGAVISTVFCTTILDVRES